MSQIDKKLAELGITLPTPAKPVANYVGWVRTGNLVYTAGQVTLKDGKLEYQGKVGKDFSVEDGAKADLKRWMQSVDVSGARAGLLLCADLEIAKKIIAAEPQLPGDLAPPDKLKELIVFSVSEQYLALRKALGIAIG